MINFMDIQQFYFRYTLDMTLLCNDEIINYTQEDINIEDKLFGKLKKVNINEKVNINKNKEYKQNELNIPNIIERINIMSEELNQLRLLLNKYSDKS